MRAVRVSKNQQEMEQRREALISSYMRVSPIRHRSLFSRFLPAGYRQTTISSVPVTLIEPVILAKIHLGMIITLYDDFADNPKYRNPRLLGHLYQLNIGRDQLHTDFHSPLERQFFELARQLFLQLKEILTALPNYQLLEPVLQFDIEQFYSCNRHSNLMSQLPEIRNLKESQELGGYNMGIVAAGTIDLMAVSDLDSGELGQCRGIFHLGQDRQDQQPHCHL